MSTHKEPPGGSPKAFSHRLAAQRLAILLPLLGPAKSDAEWREKEKAVRKLWADLTARGRDVIEAHLMATYRGPRRKGPAEELEDYFGKRMRYMPMCRSPFRWKESGGTTCGMTGLCPFCWGRSVGGVWDSVADLLHPRVPGGMRRRSGIDHDLIYTSRTVDTRGAMEEVLHDRLRGRAYARAEFFSPRRCETRSFDYVAGYEVVSADFAARPAADGGRALRGRLTVRQLFAVRPDAELGSFREGPRWPLPFIKRIPRADLKRTARAVGALCRYPTGLLVPPSGAALRDAHGQALEFYLRTKHGKRLWTALGAFRDPAEVSVEGVDASPSPSSK